MNEAVQQLQKAAADRKRTAELLLSFAPAHVRRRICSEAQGRGLTTAQFLEQFAVKWGHDKKTGRQWIKIEMREVAATLGQQGLAAEGW